MHLSGYQGWNAVATLQSTILYRYASVYLQLALGWQELLNLSELVVVVQALWVEQSSRWFDSLSRHNPLDRKLNFLQVDCRL